MFPENELTPGDLESHTDRELICRGGGSARRLMVSTIPIPDHGVMLLLKELR